MGVDAIISQHRVTMWQVRNCPQLDGDLLYNRNSTFLASSNHCDINFENLAQVT
jgi:hypothetical protein